MAIPDLINKWPASPDGGTRFGELTKDPSSPSGELRPDGGRIQRVFYLPWGDLDKLHEWLEYPTIVPGQIRYISRHTPAPERDFVSRTGQTYLWAEYFTSIEGYAPPSPDAAGLRRMRSLKNTSQYALAKVTLLYSDRTYEILPDAAVIGEFGVPDEALLKRYVEYDIQASSTSLPLPVGQFKYVPGAEPILSTPGLSAPEFDICIRWHQVPRAAVGIPMLNPGAFSYPIVDLLGCVNDATFPPGDPTGWPAGTLLLAGALIRPQRSAVGERQYMIEYRMKGFRQPVAMAKVAGEVPGHNYIVRVVAGDVRYWEVTSDGATNMVAKAPGKSIHNFGDFARLFRVP